MDFCSSVVLYEMVPTNYYLTEPLNGQNLGYYSKFSEDLEVFTLGGTFEPIIVSKIATVF